MVLRRDLAVSGGARDSNPDRPADECPAAAMANEQPVMKRQRIETKNTTAEDTKSAPPDIIASPQQSINGSGCSSSTSSPSVSLTHSCTPETATPTSGDELDNVSRILPEEDIPRISPSYPDLLKVTPIDGDVADLHSHLTKQCLCGVNENLLRRLFQPENGKCGGSLKERPPVKTMQFLSNIQLLFDVYLPQNIKGFICVGVLEACEILLLQEITLIDEITQLCDHENKFVRFLAGRVLASFLLVAMKYMNVANEKLRPIVENFKALERIDEGSVRKVGVSAEILRRIVEWKNAVEHPLDEEEEDEEPMDLPPPMQPPPIETNYFATHYNPEMVAAAQTSSASTRSPVPRPVIRETENGCRQMRLTDSESFDTGSLKLGMIETLKEEWPSIVESMSMVIRNWRDIPGAEECVLAFLTFWESVISVRANLPIKETLPFHVPLNDLEKLLSAHLPGTIYKQMLTLFNEALCYGSTLALQDHPPDESCLIMFAAQIVQQVRSRWLLTSLPQERAENPVCFIGQRGESVEYETDRLTPRMARRESGGVDRALMQKFVLLVLKSVAVTAKGVRCDSSDSSIESTDFQADQDLKTIEESIRDALKKLVDFIKDTLQFHPETHYSKILIHLFADQDNYLLEAMLCTLDVTANISFRNDAFPELVAMLNPIFTFLEFLKLISNSSTLLLDFLLGNETCFLWYLLRILKYIRRNWSMFVTSCQESSFGNNCLDDTMSVLIRLRLQIQALVANATFPYRIQPILRLMENCEALYEGDEFS